MIVDLDYRIERAWFKFSKGKSIEDINDDDFELCLNEFLNSEVL